MVALDDLLAEGARFAAWWRDHDIALLPRSRPAPGGRAFAEDRSGGELVVIEAATDEAEGVWLRSSEGQRHWLAPSVLAMFEKVAHGFTVADLIAKRDVPSARPAAGVIRWLASTRGERARAAPQGLSPAVLDAVRRLGAEPGELVVSIGEGADPAAHWLAALRWPEGSRWADPEAPFDGIVFDAAPPPSGDAPFFAAYPQVVRVAGTDTGFELWMSLEPDPSGDPAVTWRDVAESTADFEAKEREGRWFAVSELLVALVRES